MATGTQPFSVTEITGYFGLKVTNKTGEPVRGTMTFYTHQGGHSPASTFPFTIGENGTLEMYYWIQEHRLAKQLKEGEFLLPVSVGWLCVELEGHTLKKWLKAVYKESGSEAPTHFMGFSASSAPAWSKKSNTSRRAGNTQRGRGRGGNTRNRRR